MATESVGFREVATLIKHVRNFWGNYQDRHLYKYMWIDPDWTPADGVVLEAPPRLALAR